MAGVRADIAFTIDATLTGASDLGSPKQRVVVDQALNLSAGTDAIDKANILFADTRTLAASATENLDLSGVLANAFGAAIAAAEVVAIAIVAADANTNNVTFGPGAANGFIGPFGDASDRLSVKPGEHHALVSRSGWAVTPATGDILTVANAGAGSTVTYDVVIVGRTVAA